MLMMSKATTKAMAKFVSWAMDAAWEGCGLDGGELQDKAEELGLIVKAPPPPDSEWNYWFELSDEIKTALKA